MPLAIFSGFLSASRRAAAFYPFATRRSDICRYVAYLMNRDDDDEQRPFLDGERYSGDRHWWFADVW